ncbi:MAG: HDOD domain-containing protein [Phycisphaerae bacterium]
MNCSSDRQAGIREDLRGLFEQAKMPSNPALASQILMLSKDSRSSAEDFGALIRTDPALYSRLIKTANSPVYGQREPVTTCERAIMVLGLNRVKTVSLGFQLITHLDRLGGSPFDMSKFWQQSLLRACLARAIARQVVAGRREEAFLIGLLLDCGVPLLVQIDGSCYANLHRSKLSPVAFYAVERETFSRTHVDAIAAMAAEWQLPELIATPLTRHHQRMQVGDNGSELERLTAISHFVGSLCFAGDLKVDPEEKSLQQFGVEVLGLDEAGWAVARELAEDEYRHVSAVYSDILPEEIDVAHLLGEANEQLARVAHDVDQRLVDIESERDSIQEEQRRLTSALREYRERAAADPLTSVLNRGALTDAARKAIKRSRDDAVPVGVLFVDLDNFKMLNDTCGHKFGDTVLKAVAACLDRRIGRHGIVGRYGGEEFAGIVQGLSADATRALVEDVTRGVRAIDVPASDGCPCKVTCSVGGIWWDRVEAASADDLFAAADRLMYKAKRAGKDRWCFEAVHNACSVEATAVQAGYELDIDAIPTGSDSGTAGGTELDRLLSAAEALNSAKEGEFSGFRKQRRQQLVTPCTLHYFTDTSSETHAVQAVTRNVSTGGIGLLVVQPMVRGEAVEVALNRDSAELFLAGLVAFCRHIEGTIHEVGVQFVAHSVTPIISGDGSEALEQHDWVARAVRAKREGKLETQPP